MYDSIIIYIAIGAFVAGCFGDEDEMAVITTIVWPIWLVGGLTVWLSLLPYKLGQKIAEICKGEK